MAPNRRSPTDMTRRGFLRTAALTAGAASALAALPRLGRRAHGAVTPTTPFPTIFIQLRGGWDPVYHFCARTGYVNRNVTADGIRETAAGVRWFQPTMAAMTPHMEDATIIRNVRMSSNIDHHTGPVELWFGDSRNPTARPPWANYLASGLLARAAVPAPSVAQYWIRQYSSSDRDTNYVAYHNTSPDPLGATQRIVDIAAFARSLDLSRGLPPKAEQLATYDLIGKLDRRLYNPVVQPSTVSQFDQANQQANELLGQSVSSIWPPDDETRARFNLGDADLTATGLQGTPHLKPMLALAYQLARYQVSHVISMTNPRENEYDSHGGQAIDNVRQKDVGTRMFDVIAPLLTALKATPSPLDATLSMFDTTHVVIASEMGRSWNAENGTGTLHWDSTHVACFGGRFKRGYGFGDLDDKLNAIPADFATGALNQGRTASWMNVVATILKANGLDPSGYSDARPIDAVLKP
jgi:hypothetical protein